MALATGINSSSIAEEAFNGSNRKDLSSPKAHGGTGKYARRGTFPANGMKLKQIAAAELATRRITRSSPG